MKTIPEEQKTGKQLLQPHPNWYKKNKEEKTEEVEGGNTHKFKSLHLVEGKSPFDWWDGKTSLKARHVVLLACILYSIVEVYNYRFQSIPSLKKYFCLNGTFSWMKYSDKSLEVNSEETICICYSCCLVLIYQIPHGALGIASKKCSIKESSKW